MKPPVEEVRAHLHAIYENLKRIAKDNDSCCHRCTVAHCCSEPVFADESEARAILASLTPEQIEELKPKVAAWMQAAQASGMFTQDIYDPANTADKGTTYSARWRFKVNTPCPLLKDNRCSVYANRPMACATFFAGKIEPDDCQNVNAQRYVLEWPNEILGGIMQVIISGHQPERIHMDHLGVLLHNLLFETHITTASTTEREIEYA